LVTNCSLINSPNTGLGFYGTGTSGVVVNNSYFGNPVIYGLWSDAAGNNGGLTYLGCSAKQFVDDVIVANSQFENAGEPAILGNMTDLQILNNTFTNNHSYSIPFNDDGGQIDLTPCTDSAAVVGNVFQNGSIGPNGHVVQGIELHGTNLTVVNNAVKNNSGDGISLGGASNVFIANWDQSTATVNNAGGISIAQSASGDSLRPVDSITIDRANIVGNSKWGVWFNTADQPVNHVSITNSCLETNGLGSIYLNGPGPDVVFQNNSTSGCGPH